MCVGNFNTMAILILIILLFVCVCIGDQCGSVSFAMYPKNVATDLLWVNNNFNDNNNNNTFTITVPSLLITNSTCIPNYNHNNYYSCIINDTTAIQNSFAVPSKYVFLIYCISFIYMLYIRLYIGKISEHCGCEVGVVPEGNRLLKNNNNKKK